eukprot:1867519-Rhodomonas_salina.2
MLDGRNKMTDANTGVHLPFPKMQSCNVHMFLFAGLEMSQRALRRRAHATDSRCTQVSACARWPQMSNTWTRSGSFLRYAPYLLCAVILAHWWIDTVGASSQYQRRVLREAVVLMLAQVRYITSVTQKNARETARHPPTRRGGYLPACSVTLTCARNGCVLQDVMVIFLEGGGEMVWEREEALTK